MLVSSRGGCREGLSQDFGQQVKDDADTPRGVQLAMSDQPDRQREAGVSLPC
ncbi:hypothetical protein [Pseudomonas leptonychotis]|uniref:hypothetical protein n=1 Tax=Pseudomonas leptonychotis TaxID=2448482 RepID=UPI0039EE25AE